jgi:hypothetical protein
MKTQHKVKERPFAEGSKNLTCATAFICKTEIKIVLRGGYSCQRLAMGFLLSSILNKLRAVPSSLKKLAHLCSFIKLGTPPHFSFHKPWLTESIGYPPTFTYHGGVPFFLDYNGLTSSLAKLMTSR